MKRNVFVLMIFGFLFSAYSNDYVEIKNVSNLEYHKHKSYELWYDSVSHNPAVVVWDLTKDEAELSDNASGNRATTFKQCGSSVKHTVYSNTGYDRGHMCPNNDRDWDKESASETFKCCNICPQTHALNAGSWKTYENYAHELAKKNGLVTIVCGPIYSDDVIIVNGMRVPSGFFKMFIVNENVLEAYIFCQDNTFTSSSVEEIEKVTNLVFEIKE